jgi:hypothetical protein
MLMGTHQRSFYFAMLTRFVTQVKSAYAPKRRADVGDKGCRAIQELAVAPRAAIGDTFEGKQTLFPLATSRANRTVGDPQ